MLVLSMFSGTSVSNRFIICNTTAVNNIVIAEEQSPVKIYTIYDEDRNLLFERENVEIGDNYLSKDFKYYEVIDRKSVV